MHWTALLAYRRFPPEARVIDDVACIHCGYNLRGARAIGSCSECGKAVGDSLFVLASPSIVSRGLRMASQGFLAALGGLLLAFLAELADWWLILATAVIALASLWRAIGISLMRYRGSIERLPIIGGRLMIFLVLAWIECVTAIAQWALTYWVIKTGGPLWLKQDLTIPTVLWLTTLFVCMVAANRFGHAMATMLGYGWMMFEFKLQWIISAAAVAIVIASIVVVRLNVPEVVRIIFVLLFAAALFAGLLSITIALWHVSNAAEHNDEFREDAIDPSPSGLDGPA